MELTTSNKTALLVGASGLVGGELLDHLLKHGAYRKVIAPTRSKLKQAHAKLSNPLIDFDKLGRYDDLFRVNDVYIALGTTIKKAGSKEAFRRVDYDYIVTVAGMARRAGANQCLLVSSAGANSESAFFYTRVKGQTEEAVTRMDYWAVHVFRPGVLLGDRKEMRPAEIITGKVTSLLRGISPTLLGDYNPTHVSELAERMVSAAQAMSPGVRFYGARDLVSDKVTPLLPI